MPPIPDEKERKKRRTRSPGPENEDTGTLDSSRTTFDQVDPAFPPNVAEALKRMNENEIPLDLIEALLVDINTKGSPGAVLIFLPGWNIISNMLNRLENHPIFGNKSNCLILPLHSQLTGKEQHRVFEQVPPGVRKVIFG